GSCSYLGLELDQRLKNAGKDAIDKYGMQFSSSRAYVSIKSLIFGDKMSNAQVLRVDNDFIYRFQNQLVLAFQFYGLSGGIHWAGLQIFRAVLSVIACFSVWCLSADGLFSLVIYRGVNRA